jgi:hypothetical protein
VTTLRTGTWTPRRATLISEYLERIVTGLDEDVESKRDTLHPGAAADRIATHRPHVVKNAVSALGDDERTAAGV